MDNNFAELKVRIFWNFHTAIFMLLLFITILLGCIMIEMNDQNEALVSVHQSVGTVKSVLKGTYPHKNTLGKMDANVDDLGEDIYTLTKKVDSLKNQVSK